MQALQLGSWKELQIHEILWTAGDMLAIRVFNEVAGLFDKRRLTGDWFDVEPIYVKNAMRIAAEKTGVPTFSHGDMLNRVSSIRKKRIEAAIKAS